MNRPRNPVPQERVGASSVRLPRSWMWLSAAAGSLAFAGSVLGLLKSDVIYGRESDSLINAAIAQDVVNGLLVSPLIVILAWRAGSGSVGSWLSLIGFLAFTVYNYSIYAFSIHFGPLFLLWVAVLGVSIFAVAGTIASLVPEANRLVGRTSTRLTGWVLMATSLLFALLWLSEIVPDLLAGAPSTSASAWNVPTNPVHVLDLGLFLPAVFISGLLLILEHVWGHTTAVGSLAFLGLTTMPILVTPVVSQIRAIAPEWSILLPVGTLAIVLWVVFFRQLRSASRARIPRPDGAARALGRRTSEWNTRSRLVARRLWSTRP